MRAARLGIPQDILRATRVNALLLLHSAGSSDVLEQWRNHNLAHGCTRVKFLTSRFGYLPVPYLGTLGGPLTISRHHQANNHRDRLDGPPCP